MWREIDAEREIARGREGERVGRGRLTQGERRRGDTRESRKERERQTRERGRGGERLSGERCRENRGGGRRVGSVDGKWVPRGCRWVPQFCGPVWNKILIK